MKVKALKSFCGLVNMTRGQVKEVDPCYVDDLVRAGYIEPLEKVEKKAEVKEAEVEAEVEAEKKPATKSTRGRKKNNG